MRTIKFRGKSICEDTITTRDRKINKGDWVYGSLIVDSQPYIVGEIADVDKDFIAPEFWIPVDKDTIGQFTGLHDKNGVEIYEGDKLVITQSFQVLDGEVIYHEDTACYRLKIDEDEQEVLWYLPKEMEVIGNIHEEVEE